MTPKTAIYYDPIFLAHDTGNHPENHHRLEAIVKKLKSSSFHSRLEWVKPEPATPTQVEIVHSPHYVRWLEERILLGAHYLDADTVVCHESWEAALTAAGELIGAARAVAEGKYKNAFCAVRPPGHHAEAGRAMGFCLINNVAVGARTVQREMGLDKVAVIDFDVHHGNGTQHIFYDDPSVFYVSTHLWPHYPGTGSEDETGEGAGKGTTLNIPMTQGDGDEAFAEKFDKVIVPAVLKFRPEMIFISAGFDGHKNDPLGGLALTEAGFAAITRKIAQLADDLGHGRVVSALEGGYDLPALAASVGAHVGELVKAGKKE
ncbi:MAG: histone deacetylase [Nitrospinae bacterium]|nr:histone deacetylase [Nitrospinota bacterium]